jgi:mono/diheme cytochrome c family protein
LGGDAGAGDSEGDAGAARSEPAGGGPASTAPKGAAVAKAAPAPVVVPEVVEAKTYIAPPRGPHKTKVPTWVMPVLIALPLWAFFYPGAFGNHKSTVSTDPLVIGAGVYRSAGCSTCHGSSGEGGVGPALHNKQSVLTFPKEADQVNWVKTGSSGVAGQLYGDPARPGGQKGPAKGIMPAFSSSLSPSQIDAVVKYEREKL